MNLRSKEKSNPNIKLSISISSSYKQNTILRGTSALFLELKDIFRATDLAPKASLSIRNQRSPIECFVDNTCLGRNRRFVNSSLDITGIK